MAEGSTTTVVRIMGVDYPIKGNAPSEYVQKIALYVDGKMKEISSEQQLSSENIAVLAAINIADELFSVERNTESKVENIKERIARLTEKLDREIRVYQEFS